MSRIYLIGFMGVGKSTAGRKLASKLGWQYIDIDKVFEEKYKLGIDAFFIKYGEELFRKLENDILKSTFELDNYVISTGGGTPCFMDGMKQINENGISVYLKMNEQAILSRLVKSKQRRPLVSNKPEVDLLDFINAKLRERDPIYSQAMITVQAISINIDSLLAVIKANYKI